MSELHRFIFEGMPVRGMLVKIHEDWQELLARRSERDQAYPPVVAAMLGEMTAASILLQANIKFNGALVLQVSGDGPVKLMVSEVQPNLSFRSTTKLVGSVDGIDAANAVQALFNLHGKGQCAITLDPQDRKPGQQPYQGVVPLYDEQGHELQSMAAMLEHYMKQSEQLDTRLVLAADAHSACGLLLQRLPVEGQNNLQGQGMSEGGSAGHGEVHDDDFLRIAHLASTLSHEELLRLDAETLLRRLFWQEPIRRLEALTEAQGPRFRCSCSRERVANMLIGLGREEVDETLEEVGVLDVGCDFCGRFYRFDAVDVTQLFTSGFAHSVPASDTLN